MDIFEAIETRYSHKEPFLPETVPLAHLEQIARAGLAAPSGSNSQSVRLIILPDRAAMEPLYSIVQTTGLETAPAGIAVLTDGATQTSQNNFELEDYSAATENMLLAATALGYGSLWLDFPWFNKDNRQAACEYMRVPESHRLRVVVLVGKPDGPGARREKMPFEERLSYGKFGVKNHSVNG
jgi:nitroreductase